ncbi:MULTISPECIES: hypothetical protein [unclassified Tolypothrix]|uniref:hypothetical protein n=1 Tax=unclassified Tolypothrix TaxID=2649714 RepID=UPI0005EAC254|nr:MULTISPECIES: hypothetical protein [unclassified Tolypothrix]EKF05921.1 hypothetical protein FDUTEX481_00272 [Tolypothrix sp. PCC 7601]UYD31401.1 hypothetical protein HG267_19890 [Tolypothrix sp. PCC 7601]
MSNGSSPLHHCSSAPLLPLLPHPQSLVPSPQSPVPNPQSGELRSLYASIKLVV